MSAPSPELVAERHRAHRDAQRRGLLGVEVEVGQVVVVGMDAVADLAASPIVSVVIGTPMPRRISLSRSNARRFADDLRRDSPRHLAHDVVARQRRRACRAAARAGSGRVRPRPGASGIGRRLRAASVHSAAHTAAAAASSNSTGSSAAGRPIDTTCKPCRGEHVDDADRARRRRSGGAGRVPDSARSARSRASRSPPTRRRAGRAPSCASRSSSAVTLWCETPRCRSPWIGERHAQARRSACRPARPRRRAPVRPRCPRSRAGSRCRRRPGPIATTAASACAICCATASALCTDTAS